MWDASDMLRLAEPKPIDHVLKLFARSLPLAAPLCSDTWSPWSISYLIHQPMLDCNSGSIKTVSVHHSVQSQIIRLHDIDCTVAAFLQFLEIHSLWIQWIVDTWCNLQDQQGSNAHTHTRKTSLTSELAIPVAETSLMADAGDQVRDDDDDDYYYYHNTNDIKAYLWEDVIPPL